MLAHEPDRHSLRPSRRAVLAGAASVALAPNAIAAPASRVPFGSAAQIETFRADPRYRDALKRYCDVIVPMNDLKWEALRHDRARFDFSGSDELVEFALTNGKALRGHALLWGDALPPWAKRMESRAEAEKELVTHIETVVDRYRGRIATWDVVNEVIRLVPSPEQPFRDTVWSRLLGNEHVEIAFRTAARVDPKARLVLNDFNFEQVYSSAPERQRTALSLCRGLLDKGIPVHGIGMQAHLYAEKEIDVDSVRRFATEAAAMGLELEVTELDVIDWKLPRDAAERDRRAATLVSTFLEAVASVRPPKAIVTWGLSDRYSWIHETFPRKDSARARPLPLDEEFRPKLMMAALERHRRGAA